MKQVPNLFKTTGSGAKHKLFYNSITNKTSSLSTKPEGKRLLFAGHCHT